MLNNDSEKIGKITISSAGGGGTDFVYKSKLENKPNIESAFLKLVKNIYEKVLDDTIKLEVIHGGLECGLFVSLDPELQVNSIRPDIHNAHSPDEYLEIKVWK